MHRNHTTFSLNHTAKQCRVIKMNIALSDEKDDLIKTIAKKNGFDDYGVEVKSGSMKGDGYLGIINTVLIQDKKIPQKELHLVMKSAMNSTELREHTPVRKAYDREIYMYETVFPLFRKFSDENGIKNVFTETAKCYGSLFTDKQECLVLEDLKDIGFRLWDRMKPMNAEHISAVFAVYGKFHGTSLALKYLEPKKYEELKINLVSIFESDKEEDKEKFKENAKLILGNGFRAAAGNERASQALNKFVPNAAKFFMEEARREDKFWVVLHGDCWTNNMMFKYLNLNDTKKPSKVCLLDWQISAMGNLICDLSYFFYACAAKDVLYHIKTYLKLYHSHLCQTVKEAGVDPDKVMTFEELEEQWRIFSKYGLFMALFVTHVIYTESTESPDLSELAKEGKNILESIAGVKSVNEDKANRRICDILIFMDEFGYL